MDFLNRETLPKFRFTPDNAKKIHPLLNGDNYLTYAMCLAYNKDLTEEDKTDLENKMKNCYNREQKEFMDLQEQKLSNDIEEEKTNE